MYNGNELKKGTYHSAGYDLATTEGFILAPGTRRLVPTGITLRLNTGTFGLIKARSGLSCCGIDVGAGVIDCDYAGEVKVLLINNGTEPMKFDTGDRVAQLIVLPYLTIFQNSDHIGFGSTGK